MPRGQQATTVVDRPLRTTRKNGGADQPIVQKPPRAKRVADENAGNEATSRKRAAFGDLTNVSFLKECISEIMKYLFLVLLALFVLLLLPFLIVDALLMGERTFSSFSFFIILCILD